MAVQVTESQQALPDADLDELRSSLRAFFTKQPGPPSSRSAPVPQAPDSSLPPATASKAVEKASDKTAAAAAKKGKGSNEPAVPTLQTVPGQIAELSRWSSMLEADAGLVLQDADFADWLAMLLKEHC